EDQQQIPALRQASCATDPISDLKFEISKKAEDQQQIPHATRGRGSVRDDSGRQRPKSTTRPEQQIPALRQAGCAPDPISDLKFEISKKAEDQQQIPALRQAGCATDPISDLKFEISKKAEDQQQIPH